MDFPEEFSCYNEYITSISELHDITTKYYSKIRVLHCPNLISMQGIEFQTKIIELNLSSNAIQRIEGLHNMSLLRVLNLSCNNIRVINCLGGLYSLQKLNLSYNKISSLTSLKQLYGDAYSSFTHFDIRGNNISQVSEIKNLSGCTFLIDVAFQGQSGSNTVCKDPEYHYHIVNALPMLKFLDHQPLSNFIKPTTPKINQLKEESPQKIDIPEKVPEKVIENNTQDNKKLQQDLDELYDAYKELSFKYKHSEEYWTSCIKKLEDSNNQSVYEKREIENENRRLRKKLNSKESKINTLKSKTAAAVNNTGAKDKVLEDFHYQISNLMKDLGESQRMSQQAVDDVYKKQEKIKNLEKSNYELKNEIKRLETTTNQLHAKALESSTNALHKYEELQKKYEDSLEVLEEKDSEINILKKKNMDILDLNAKFDENWSSKYREAVHARENIISSLREEIHKLTLSEKAKTQEFAYAEKEENRNKIWELEQKIILQANEYKDKERESDQKFQDIIREGNDLKEMLKMSVEKEAKSKDFISELTGLIKQLQIQLDKEITEKLNLKKQYEEKIAGIESEAASYKTKNDSLRTRLDILEKDINIGDDSMHIKNREIAKLKREILDLNIIIEDHEEKSKNLKIKLEKTEKNLTNEIDDLIEQNKELELSLSTKNTIIADQSESIRELKQLLSQYEQEIDQYQNNKNSYKENYENKLQDAYDEIEVLKNKLNNTESSINEIEVQINELNKKKNEYKDENQELKAQLLEKNQILEFVEAEILNIKKDRDNEINELVQEKDNIINDLKSFRDDLSNKAIGQDKEIKEKNTKIKQLEYDVSNLAKELQNETKKGKEMQEEIRALLLEMDNQKRLASEKISQLSKMFS